MDVQALSALGGLAERQHGLFTTEQAFRSGWSPADLARRTRQGWVRQVRRGVYAFAGRAPSAWEVVMAAALAAGEGAVLSHRSAAAIHGLWRFDSGPPELSVSGGTRLRLRGVRVHRVTRLDPRDVAERRGVAVTSPARTLVDLAGVLPTPAVELILEDGIVRRRWTYVDVTACLDRSGTQGRPGARELRRLLGRAAVSAGADSRLEARVLRMLQPLRPFEVQHQVVIDGRVLLVDAAWPDWHVGVEVDGRQHDMSSMGEFTRDRSRRNLLEGAGWRIAHVTAAMSSQQILLDVGRLLPYWFAGPALAARGLRLAG
ncbi:MAG: type IV toxin-antitoxin system AbiEi family antitoxin domain-containing protein [Acidimicrobiaceae bacterium]|nr:type IV toxin-antitoxin system AbiEi family antitoxin domain-containing protein [Acidimicrobiaceae bacterium]